MLLLSLFVKEPCNVLAQSADEYLIKPVGLSYDEGSSRYSHFELSFSIPSKQSIVQADYASLGNTTFELSDASIYAIRLVVHDDGSQTTSDELNKYTYYLFSEFDAVNLNQYAFDFGGHKAIRTTFETVSDGVPFDTDAIVFTNEGIIYGLVVYYEQTVSEYLDNFTDLLFMSVNVDDQKYIPDKADYINAVLYALLDNGIFLDEWPLESEWSVLDYDGYKVASVTAQKDAQNYVISAWIEADASAIHYLDTKDGVLIDDGIIQD